MGMGARTDMIMGMTTGIPMADRLHLLAQWFSPAFPLGAFAWSHGLEAAIACGEIGDADSLRDWLETLLVQGSGRNDAILIKLAHEAADPAPVAELARAFAFGAERLAETEAQGRAFTATVNALYGWEMAPLPLPVALGQAGRRMEVAPEPLLRHALHAFTANLVSAAVRFMPLGQSDGQAVLAGLFAVIDRVVREALTASAGDLGGAAIRADLAALQHETMTTRIFRS